MNRTYTITSGQIDLAKVTKTYSGKTGCACGCGGSYSYAEGNDPGYFVDANPRTVKTRVNKINKALTEGREVEVWVFDDESIFELLNESGQRAVRVYLAN